MHRYYCSYFDRNYLIKALALITSMNQHLKGGFTLYAVCLDELTRLILKQLAPPNVVPIPLHEVDGHDEALLTAKRNRSCVEYYWTLTPSVLLWVLDRYPEIELLTYLDGDMYFFGDSQPVFDELGNDSVLIHEHRFPEHLKHLAKYGKYNVGLLSFRRDEHGMKVLRWWRERCIEWCYAYLDNGRYGDQLYLDDWTERFEKVHVLQHIGAAVAPWNHIQYRFRVDPAGAVWAEHLPLIFYHFHSLDFVHPGVVVPAKFLHYPLREDIIRCCVMPYVAQLLRTAGVVRGILPEFNFGLYKEDLLTAEHTFVAEKRYRDDIRAIGINHPTIELSADWECHCSEQMYPPAPPYEPPVATTEGKECLPKISLVVPSLNQGGYLQACLDSILSQEYPNLELIVMDGGSTDGSLGIITRYRDRLAYWQSKPDGGQYRAVNEGFRRSTGEIMGWLNSDDMLHPGGLRVIAEVFSRRPEVEFLTGKRVGFDGEGNLTSYGHETRTWCRSELLRKDLIHNYSLFVMQEATYWRRSLWERAGSTFDLGLKLAADFELWLRFSRYARLYTVDALIGGFRYYSEEQRCNRLREAYLAECDAVIDREASLVSTEVPPSPPPELIPYPLCQAKPEILTRSAGLPAISIVTPSYNQAEFLEECIDSVLSQNYPNLQYIIMDGGSTDGSVDIIRKYEKHLAYWQSGADGGQYRAVKEGFRRSGGEIMAWLNSDDMYHPGALWLVADTFRAFAEVEWVTGHPTLLDAEGVAYAYMPGLPLWSRERYLSGQYGNPYIQQESVFWRRTLWEKAGSTLDASLEVAGDMELWSRFFRHAQLHTLNAPLAGFRSHGDQRSERMRARYHEEADSVVERERQLFQGGSGQLQPAPAPLEVAELAEKAGSRISPDNFGFFTYSRTTHFPFLQPYARELHGHEVAPDSCELTEYQELLVCGFIRQNLEPGRRILQLGGEDAPVLEALKGEYNCWHLASRPAAGGRSSAVTRVGSISDCPLLPDAFFDFIFSTAESEALDRSADGNRAIWEGMLRILKRDGFALNCFELTVKEGGIRGSRFLGYLLERTGTPRPKAFMEINPDPYLHAMSREAYDRCRGVAGMTYDDYGSPISFNVLWSPLTARMIPPKEPRKRPGRVRQATADVPSISVVIPSYNYGHYLGDCLDSILSQDYPNLELLVMDGGSTDNTLAVLKKYERHLSYLRSHPDGGQYSALEEGLRRSTGEIMTWLNADDLFHPGAFKTVSRIFSSHPEVEWLMGRPNSFDEEGRQKVVLSFLPMNSRAKYLADQELIQQEGVFWRRGLWERSGACLDKELLLAADLELWARFFRSATLFSVDTLLAGFRDHPLQKSKDKAGYTAEANRVLAREREYFAAGKSPFNPPAPLPILVKNEAEPAASAPDPHYAAGAPS